MRATIVRLTIVAALLLIGATAQVLRGAEDSQASTTAMPVLVLQYFPTQDGVNLDPVETGTNVSISAIRAYTAQLTAQTSASLEAGSTYHGYKDATTAPSLDYQIVQTHEFFTPMPRSAQFPPFTDKFQMFSNPSIGVPDICDYVDGGGVEEVWIWMYHHGSVVPIESNMAMGTNSQSHWNHPTYGDVSNSNGANDLPVCDQTYVVYEYNYTRGLGEALEDHGHHLEAVLSHVDNSVFITYTTPWNLPSPAVNHCGNVHFPPNGRSDYDWYNQADVVSNCEDWHIGGAPSQTKVTDCHTWSGPNCTEDSGAAYKVWWMQNMPGAEYNLGHESDPTFCSARNWWDFTSNFDAAMDAGRTLIQIPNSDSSPPTTSITAPSPGAALTGNVTLSADAFDAGCGVSQFEFIVRRQNGSIAKTIADSIAPYSVSWRSSEVENGVFTIEGHATDRFGYSTTSAAVPVTITNPCNDITGDGVPPTVALTAPSASAVLTDSTTLSANASDAGCGVSQVDFLVRRPDTSIAKTLTAFATPYSVSWLSYQVPNGSYTIEARARDTWGLTTTSPAVSVTITNVCTDVNGDNGVNSGDMGVLNRYNGKTTADPGWYAVATFDFVANGTIDSADWGALKLGQVCGIVDTQAPQVSFIAPLPAQMFKQGDVFLAEARSTDNYLTNKVQFYVDGQLASPALGLVAGNGQVEAGSNGIDITAAFWGRFNTAGWSIGTHTIGAKGTDFRNNSSPIEQVTITIHPDTDGDGFNDGLEAHMRTDPLDPCPDNNTDHAWPPDANNDRVINSGDMGKITQQFGKNPASPDWEQARRYDLNGDNVVNIADRNVAVIYYGLRCTN